MELLSSELGKKNTISFSVKMTKKEYDEIYDETFAQYSHRANVPGVKKGEATREQIEQIFGKQIFHPEALEQCYTQVISFAKLETGMEFLANINLDSFESFEDGNILKFTGIDVKQKNINSDDKSNSFKNRLKTIFKK
ncbi:MAG: trigger factor [Clostridia bacterium]